MGATSANLCPAFGQLGEEQRAFFVSASSRLPSPENKPTRAACFGVTYRAVLPTENGVGGLEVCSGFSGWGWKYL